MIPVWNGIRWLCLSCPFLLPGYRLCKIFGCRTVVFPPVCFEKIIERDVCFQNLRRLWYSASRLSMRYWISCGSSFWMMILRFWASQAVGTIAVPVLTQRIFEPRVNRRWMGVVPFLFALSLRQTTLTVIFMALRYLQRAFLFAVYPSDSGKNSGEKPLRIMPFLPYMHEKSGCLVLATAWFRELLTRIELVTSSLPRKCSTTELQQQHFPFEWCKST